MLTLPSRASRAELVGAFYRARINSQPIPAVKRSTARAIVRGIYLDGCTLARHRLASETPDFSLLWKFADAPAEIYDRRNLRLLPSAR